MGIRNDIGLVAALVAAGMLAWGRADVARGQEGAVTNTTVVDGVEWDYVLFGGEATIFRLPWKGVATGDITIPARVDGHPVVDIGEFTFSESDGLTSVVIQNGIRNIGRGAFGGCRALASVSIPGSVTNIEDNAFNQCENLRSVSIPGSVRQIGVAAFGACYALTTVTIGEGVEEIGGWAFSFTAIRTLAIPGSVKRIGERVFHACGELKSLDIPDSVEELGNLSFTFCGNLERVSIGTGVTNIGELAFCYCLSLVSVEIPDSVEGIGENAFLHCEALKTLSIPASVESLGKDALKNTGLEELYVPAVWAGTGMVSGAGVPADCAVHYVETAEQTLEWAALGEGFTAGDRVELAATASGGTVRFSVVTGPAVVEGKTLTFTGAGTVRVRARAPGSQEWASAEETREVRVSPTDAAGRRVFADLAANYAGDWGDGGNGGEGFGAWRIGMSQGGGSGWAGCGIWDPSANGFEGTWGGKTRAFGLVGKGEGWSVAALRDFGRSLRPGDAFSLEMGLNWDSNQDGAKKGFALTAGGEDVVTVNHGSYPGNISLNGHDGHPALNAYGLHPMVWTFTAVDGRTLRAEATRRDGGGGVFSTNLAVTTSALDGFRLQSAGQNPNDSGADGDKRQSYFDDFRLFLGEDAPATSGGVPYEWIDEHAAEILAEHGGDYEAAATATTANGRTVSECYVAGLEDLASADDFTVFIEVRDGEPRVTWRPDLNEGGTKQERTYKLYGKKSLLGGEPWTDVTGEPALGAAGWRFFRATVELP